ncbi:MULTISPECIES: GatB/YqeY domain-containing protein [Christiangramia]|uniref:Transamidase GatB domain protein n=1 Tax=Christiangramia flava JLT2011 TaxID=1229726 RepID=A0A1L7I5L5_9FLAO|nr:GatB/YqeY domain-containing protein [Christiangramia flava]APU68876.1 Transamidase GatB domain protein [Christiangramia flava JLT2011]OSS38979.1 Transamidase GatB domain protein [Christiangramia flava JLT2011]
MSLQDKVMAEMKAAMKAKDSAKLEALRAVKSAILLANTESDSKDGLSEEEELKLLQKLVKQRKESAQIYQEQGREDLAAPELEQALVIEAFLPEQLSEEEVEAKVEEVIAKTGASGMQDMGKVMGMVTKELAGRADGRTISTIVKQKLSN